MYHFCVTSSPRHEFQRAPVLSIRKANGNRQVLRRQPRPGLLRPLEYDEARAVEDLVQTQIFELLGAVQPVQIHMIDGDRAAIRTDKGKRRAGNVPGRPGPLGNPTSQHGLPRAQVAGECDDITPPEQRAQAAAQVFSLSGARGFEA